MKVSEVARHLRTLPQPTISQLLRAAEGELASKRGLALANVLTISKTNS